MDIVVRSLFIRSEDELQLHAFCFEIKHWFIPWKEDLKLLFKRMKSKKVEPITELDFDEFAALVKAYYESIYEVAIPETRFEESQTADQVLMQEEQRNTTTETQENNSYEK